MRRARSTSFSSCGSHMVVVWPFGSRTVNSFIMPMGLSSKWIERCHARARRSVDESLNCAVAATPSGWWPFSRHRRGACLKRAVPHDKKAERQAQHIEERSTPPTPVIYDIVRRYGEDEMERPAVSLWWSGLAAGLSMSFSLLLEGILRMHLPDAEWTRLVTSLGYPIGFVMVVLARQQLFTENTITVVLPIIADPTR